jgi:hypothetical protein
VRQQILGVIRVIFVKGWVCRVGRAGHGVGSPNSSSLSLDARAIPASSEYVRPEKRAVHARSHGAPAFGTVRAMANLRDPFAPYCAPDEDTVATALRSGLVALDTNVMLAAYRFERQARDELFTALAKLGDRLWIPYQVALEFHRNRLGVIAAQEAFFGKTRADLEKAMSSYLSQLREFTNRIAMPQARMQELEQMIRGAHAQVTAQVTSAEGANEVHLDGRDSDEVLARLEVLFDGRVGEPMAPDMLESARKEARRRVEQKIPPGYADKDKADPSGDYLVWVQLLQEAATRKLPVVLLTDDSKEDWVRREHGLTLGARPELCAEMSAATGAAFMLMNTATFLRHAEEYLSVSVSPETVDQARELPAAWDALQRAAAGSEVMRLREQRYQARTRRRDAESVAFLAARAEEELIQRVNRNADDPTLEADLHELRARRAAAEHMLYMARQDELRLVEYLDSVAAERESQPDPHSPLEQEIRRPP